MHMDKTIQAVQNGTKYNVKSSDPDPMSIINTTLRGMFESVSLPPQPQLKKQKFFKILLTLNLMEPRERETIFYNNRALWYQDT